MIFKLDEICFVLCKDKLFTRGLGGSWCLDLSGVCRDSLSPINSVISSEKKYKRHTVHSIGNMQNFCFLFFQTRWKHTLDMWVAPLLRVSSRFILSSRRTLENVTFPGGLCFIQVVWQACLCRLFVGVCAFTAMAIVCLAYVSETLPVDSNHIWFRGPITRFTLPSHSSSSRHHMLSQHQRHDSGPSLTRS